MPFTDAEKTDIRRFVGYGVFGNTPEYPFSTRYFTFSGDLEYKMNRLQPTEEVVVRAMLVDCKTAEDAIIGTSDNLDTARAAVWYHNKNELRDRDRLFIYMCKKLADFLTVYFKRGSNLQPRLVV